MHAINYILLLILCFINFIICKIKYTYTYIKDMFVQYTLYVIYLHTHTNLLFVFTKSRKIIPNLDFKI